MLVIKRVRNGSGEEGAAIIAVVMVMLVGFIAASVIAGAVMFTIQANQSNKSYTQSFIAAESGRDQMVAKYLGSCATSIPDSVSAPLYKSVAVVSSGPDAAHQTSPASCASATQTTVFVIQSTGVGPSGSTSSITSNYTRTVTYTNQPGGSLAYLSGEFTLTQSQYTGDIVIRNNSTPWDCNSHSTIDGDLWVLNGDIVLQSTCTITGSIYAGGSVTIKSANTVVQGSIVANGFINITGNNVAIGGNLLSGSTINLDKSTNVGAAPPAAPVQVQAAGAVTIPTGGSGKVYATPQSGVSPSPAVFNPSLATVYAMTTWMDISATQPLWGSDVKWVTPASCSVDVSSAAANGVNVLNMPLSAPYTRVGVDYSACTGDVTINTNTSTVTHDVVFLVPSKVKMAVSINNALTTSLTPLPQLFFIHGDANLTNSLPDCGTGSSPTDSIGVPATLNAYLMFYTPCGIKSLPHNPFTGQYYAGNNSDPHWVQPQLTCHNMAWAPLINLGCKIANASTNNNGTVNVSILPPVLVTQTEQ